MIKVVKYLGGWVKYGNVFAFPYRWQTPAKTELWAYEKCLANPHINIYEQYFCFPWAGLVDCLKHNQLIKAKFFIDALNIAPPKFAIKRITFCQHIYALDLLPFFKNLGITDIYWSHKIIGQDEIEGIKLHPYPLYPVMHHKRDKPFKNKPLAERKYLYSFIGSYQPDLYLTPVRKWIFDLPEREDVYIKERKEWHFEQDVYKLQMQGIEEKKVDAILRKKYEEEYITVMEDTIFCLCPSGSGPNSIRIWEAIEFGCVPVVLSDKLDLGQHGNQADIFYHISEQERSIKELPETITKKFIALLSNDLP
tara:strand:+ start:1600 stop:2523 length:924 start_codon:yes stop_codon:yes gene_type:complete